MKRERERERIGRDWGCLLFKMKIRDVKGVVGPGGCVVLLSLSILFIYLRAYAEYDLILE